MDYEYNDRKQESVYSRRLKAGKRRTYFFDVRETRGNDFFLTITESRKRFNDDGYDRHKIFLYKEDFNKFVKALGEAVDYVKTDLMPDYDFDIFSHEGEEIEGATYARPKSESGNSVNEPAVAVTQAQQTAVIDSETAPSQTYQEETQVAETSTADIVAEPMNAETLEDESAEETIAETSTAEKLASEEVEKW